MEWYNIVTLVITFLFSGGGIIYFINLRHEKLKSQGLAKQAVETAEAQALSNAEKIIGMYKQAVTDRELHWNQAMTDRETHWNAEKTALMGRIKSLEDKIEEQCGIISNQNKKLREQTDLLSNQDNKLKEQAEQMKELRRELDSVKCLAQKNELSIKNLRENK